MANARALDKRRKSVKNIRKITRTMELIATARFNKAKERATAATDFTNRVTKLVSDVMHAGLEIKHPLMEEHGDVKHAKMLVLASNRGLCGGYNGNIVRMSVKQWSDLTGDGDRGVPKTTLEVSGKRGISGLKHRGITPFKTFTHFEDKPRFEEVAVLADRYLEEFIAGRLDRLDVVYTKFESASRQTAVIETLLPLGSIAPDESTLSMEESSGSESMYEFAPDPAAILEEIMPLSFKIKLFKCFLDAAVSEQVSRMVAMKSATENAGDLIKQLSMQYNRARQSTITGEIMEIIGGVEALKG